MNTFFVLLLVAFVFLMIVFNVYFRYKILGDYKYLVKNKIDFGMAHIFNEARLEKEIIPHYKGHQEVIRSFCAKIRKSLYTALGLIFLILVVAFIIKNYLI